VWFLQTGFNASPSGQIACGFTGNRRWPNPDQPASTAAVANSRKEKTWQIESRASNLFIECLTGKTGQEINAARDAKIRNHQVRPQAHSDRQIADSPRQIERVRKTQNDAEPEQITISNGSAGRKAQRIRRFVSNPG
jgi:hypothetical protein